MSEASAFEITYWGVTGTFCDPLRPSEVTDKLVESIRLLADRDLLKDLRPGPGMEARIRKLVEQELPFHERSSYGGNTTCVEVQTPDALIIFDCGSGFRELGIVLEDRWRAQGTSARREAHVLLSHAHMDHTFATPYFSPFYDRGNRFTIRGSKAVLDSLAAVLHPTSALSRIYFPPTFDHMNALQDFKALDFGAEFNIGSTRITTHALNHPGGSMAYRLENSGRVFVFATDHEQTSAPDRGLVEFARNADLLYTEGQFTAAEYEGRVGIAGERAMSRRGWGHSSIEACVRTALEAGVRTLHVGHRDPRRNDRETGALNTLLGHMAREEVHRLGRPAGCLDALIPYEGLQLRL